jgi:hypothetical protein
VAAVPIASQTRIKKKVVQYIKTLPRNSVLGQTLRRLSCPSAQPIKHYAMKEYGEVDV